MLAVKNLEVGYSDVAILKGVNLEAHSGEIHGILGVNGSGKTTLFRTINGWLPKWSGSIILNENPLKKQQISYLETEPYFYPYIKGIEYIRLLKKNNENFVIQDWNQLFDLPLDRLAQEYSTGMRKKLGLLGLLAQDRQLLILDEPLNGVDIESNVKFKEVILRLKTLNKVILLSSHMLESLIEICDKISLLSNGVIERTYVRDEFPHLEQLIRSHIKSKLDNQLDELFNTTK